MTQYDVQDWGNDFDGQSQGLSFPFCRIRQSAKTNDEGDKITHPAGSFMFNDDRDDEKELAYILLFSQRGRVKWDDPDDERPACRSINYKVPMQPVYAESCNLCPHSQWGKNGKRPSCDEIISLLCLDTEYKPFIMQVKGTGLTPTRNFLNKLTDKAKAQELAPWHYPISVKTKKVEKGSYTYYIPVYPEGEALKELLPFEQDIREEIDDIRSEIAGDWKRAVSFEQEALPAGQATKALPTGVVLPPEDDDDEGSFMVGEPNRDSGGGSPFRRRSAE